MSPTSPPRLCRCGKVVRGRCPDCSKGWTRKPKTWPTGAGDSRWRKLRKAKLTADPLCQWRDCRQLATTVDHVDGTDYATERYDWDKLRSMCEDHHRQRTAAQGHAAQRRERGEGAS